MGDRNCQTGNARRDTRDYRRDSASWHRILCTGRLHSQTLNEDCCSLKVQETSTAAKEEKETDVEEKGPETSIEDLMDQLNALNKETTKDTDVTLPAGTEDSALVDCILRRQTKIGVLCRSKKHPQLRKRKKKQM